VLSRLKKHLTPSTAIASLALVFAVTGGAFAATGNRGGSSHANATGGDAASQTLAVVAKSKAKSKTKAGPRGPAGPKGATGATGATGAAGPAGPTDATGAGTPGTTGTEGKEGKPGASVTVGKATEKECKAGKGGATVSNASGSVPICNGTTGFTETLPAGKTETGVWGVSEHTAPNRVNPLHLLHCRSRSRSPLR
jgi:hypothetical protein